MEIVRMGFKFWFLVVILGGILRFFEIRFSFREVGIRILVV